MLKEKKKTPTQMPATSRKRKKSGRGRLSLGRIVATLIFAVLLASVAAVGAAAVGLIGAVMVAHNDLGALESITLPVPDKTTRIYAADGELLAELFLENREYTPIQKIPQKLQYAFLAVEDDKFFYHKGINLRAIGRAFYVNLVSRDASQGGSTITQQLARNVYLTHEKTIARKVKEIILAIAIEKEYTKEEILESYLNLIYFGHGAYGVKTAAKTYFNKDLDDLTPAECAMLAGLPQSPNRISPFNNMERAIARRNIVLGEMHEHRFIDDDAWEAAKKEPIKLAKLRAQGYASYKAPYFVTYVTDLLTDPQGPFDYTSHMLYSQGLNIYTSLDMNAQTAAEKAVAEALRLGKEKKKNITQSAALAIDPSDGRILAMVGGRDFNESKFNRITQAYRQPGSLFKPFVYISAIEKGYKMSDLINDQVKCYPDNGRQWCPKNYDHKEKGVMTLATALKLSRNVPAVKMLSRVGVDKVIETARKMGIEAPLRKNLSMALGTNEVTPMEMVRAFASLANGGFYVEPAAILRVENANGAILYERTQQPAKRVLEQETIAQIVPVMKMVVEQGTGTRARLDNWEVAGKTGTTSDFRDAWFCGFTPTLAGTVWIGNDNNSEMGSGVTGGSIPAPAWKIMMTGALEGQEPVPFDNLLPPSAFVPAKEPAISDEATGPGPDGQAAKPSNEDGQERLLAEEEIGPLGALSTNQEAKFEKAVALLEENIN